MIVKQVHNNKIGAYVFMLLLVVIFWIKPLLAGITVDVTSFENSMPLWKAFEFTLKAGGIGFIFSLVSTIIITLSITRFNSKYALLSKPSHYQDISLCGSYPFFPASQHFNPIGLSLFFLLLTGIFV